MSYCSRLDTSMMVFSQGLVSGISSWCAFCYLIRLAAIHKCYKIPTRKHKLRTLSSRRPSSWIQWNHSAPQGNSFAHINDSGENTLVSTQSLYMRILNAAFQSIVGRIYEEQDWELYWLPTDPLRFSSNNTTFCYFVLQRFQFSFQYLMKAYIYKLLHF